jgi:hypothetical protein
MLTLSIMLAAAATAEVRTVRCPAEPPSIRTHDLVERWRLDADDEDAPLMGVISQARCREPGGDILLLDDQLCQVLVFSPDGELRGTLGREGDGPGEFRQPRVLQVLDDGRLAVQTGWPSRLIMLDGQGAPAGQWAPRVPGWLYQVRPAPGGWVASGQLEIEERREATHMVSEHFLAWFDDDGERQRDYLATESVRVFQPQTHDERQPYFPAVAWDTTNDGLLVWSTARDAYRLEYHDLDGNLQKVVEREFAPYRRTDADRQDIRDGMRITVNGVRQEVEFHLLDTEPTIHALRALPDGNLAVFTCYQRRGLPDGVVMRYDLHDRSGALLAEVRLRGDLDLELDAIQLLMDGRAVILRNYHPAASARYGMLDEGDPVREGEALQVIVCDLVEH